MRKLKRRVYRHMRNNLEAIWPSYSDAEFDAICPPH
jgi:lauroyl/myristoyl acyltransferase